MNTANDITVQGDEEEILAEDQTISQRQLANTPQRAGEDFRSTGLQHQFSSNSFGYGTIKENADQLATYATNGNQRVSDPFMNNGGDEIKSQAAEAINVDNFKKNQLRGMKDLKALDKDAVIGVSGPQLQATGMQDESIIVMKETEDQSFKIDDMNFNKNAIRKCQSNSSVSSVQNPIVAQDQMKST